MSSTIIDDELRELIAEMKTAGEVARATPCGYPNCDGQCHDGAEEPADWEHTIFKDVLHDRALYFQIYVKRGEYTGYMEVDYTGEMAASEFLCEARVMEDAARLMRLYAQRLDALQKGEATDALTD